MNISLLEILRYTRKHESVTEALFINSYLIPMIAELGYTPEMDGAGNIWATVEDKLTAPYLFVAHIDTCHQREGMIEPKVVGDIVSLDKADVMHGCLGARS